MTYSVFAVDANALSPSGCSAYTYTLNGYLPYLRAPWYQFSEQAVDDVALNGDTNPAFPFLTGHGGANQVVPFGFLGIRTDQPVLFLNPSLPPQLNHVKIRTFYFAGATLSASLNSTHTNLTRLATPLSSGLKDLYASTTLPFSLGTPGSGNEPSYNIVVNETITLSNRLYFRSLTTKGNILQCLPVTSTEPISPGQFPVAAIDGATATRWQPLTNASSSILINTTSVSPGPVSGFTFDWGSRPPLNATVYLGNFTNGEVIYGNEVVFALGVNPSKPYDAAAAAGDARDVVPVVGNTSTFAVEGGCWSGEYVRLVVEGCWEGDGVGSTVGEFIVLGGE